jgi:hypothetical protein
VISPPLAEPAGQELTEVRVKCKANRARGRAGDSLSNIPIIGTTASAAACGIGIRQELPISLRSSLLVARSINDGIW